MSNNENMAIIKQLPRRDRLEALAEEAPPRAEIAKSAKPSVLQKLHSYGTQSRTEPKKSVEEVR